MRNFSSKSLSQRRYAIPLGLMACWLSSLLAVRLVDDSIAWDTLNAFNSALYALAAYWAFSLLSYRDLRLKFIAALLSGAAWADLIWVSMYYVAGWSGYNAWLVFLAAGSALAFVGAWVKSFSEPDLPLDNEHVFLLRLKPKDSQSFIVSMIGCIGPYGGYAIYYKGKIYAFRKGLFRHFALPYNFISRYQVSDVKIPSDIMISRLNRLLGSRWSIFNNCLKLKEIWDAK